MQAGVVAQYVIATAAAIGLIYLLKPVLVTVLVATLLAFALEPMVLVLERLRIPRPAGAAVALLLLLAFSVALVFFFYNRAVDFMEELPKFSATIREDLEKFQAQAQRIENSTQSVLPAQQGKKPIPVQVQEPHGLAKLISSGASQFGEIALAISFVPFLIYFMLTWKTHVHSATLRVFPKEKRLVAYRTIGRISEMVRSFIAGNLFVGLLNAIASTAVFGALHLPYFYFLGAISAFVGLVPYLGLFFALLAPIAAGMGVLDKSQLGIVFLAVVGLHIAHHESALSQVDRAALATESAGGGAVAAVLGVDLGSLRLDSGDPVDGHREDYLRLHRAPAGVGGVAGGLSFKVSEFQSFRVSRNIKAPSFQRI